MCSVEQIICIFHHLLIWNIIAHWGIWTIIIVLLLSFISNVIPYHIGDWNKRLQAEPQEVQEPWRKHLRFPFRCWIQNLCPCGVSLSHKKHIDLLCKAGDEQKIDFASWLEFYFFEKKNAKAWSRDPKLCTAQDCIQDLNI